MGAADKSSSLGLSVFVRDRHVQVLRVFILLCSFAALRLVLFGRDVRAISLVVAIGSAFLSGRACGPRNLMKIRALLDFGLRSGRRTFDPGQV